jgi:hypothetical protein
VSVLYLLRAVTTNHEMIASSLKRAGPLIPHDDSYTSFKTRAHSYLYILVHVGDSIEM